MRRVEFGTIMLWFYVVDRTTVFTYGTKVNPLTCPKHPLPPHSQSLLMLETSALIRDILL